MTAQTPQTIVVGYDGREPSEHALEQAIDDARARNARVVAVVVDAFVDYTVAGPTPGWGYVPPLSEDGPVELQPLLQAARTKLAEAGVDGEAVWGLGDPALEILRVARERQAARIVIGHHHHSALGRILGTDVGGRVRDAAGCDVIVAS